MKTITECSEPLTWLLCRFSDPFEEPCHVTCILVYLCSSRFHAGKPPRGHLFLRESAWVSKDTKGLTDLKQPDCLAQGHPAHWAGNFIGRGENRRGKRVLNSRETLNLRMEERWRRPACRGLFYSLWTQEGRGAGSIGGWGRTTRWLQVHCSLGSRLYGGWAVLTKGCDAKSSCKRVGG